MRLLDAPLKRWCGSKWRDNDLERVLDRCRCFDLERDLLFLSDLDLLLILAFTDLDLDLDLERDFDRDLDLERGVLDRDLFFKDLDALAAVELVFLFDERVLDVDLRRLESLVLRTDLDVVSAESVFDDFLSIVSWSLLLADVTFWVCEEEVGVDLKFIFKACGERDNEVRSRFSSSSSSSLAKSIIPFVYEAAFRFNSGWAAVVAKIDIRLDFLFNFYFCKNNKDLQNKNNKFLKYSKRLSKRLERN